MSAERGGYEPPEAHDEALELQRRVRDGEATDLAAASQQIDDKNEGETIDDTTDATTDPESKEVLHGTPTILAYRQNDLFEKYGKAIMEGVAQAGRPATVKIFEAGTPEEEMVAWATEHKDELLNSTQVADNTLLHAIDKVPNEQDPAAEARGEEHAYMGQMGRIDLDKIMKNITFDAVVGVDNTAISDELNREDSEYVPSSAPPEQKEAFALKIFALQKGIFLEALKSVPESRKDIVVYVSSGPDDERGGTIANHELFTVAEHNAPRYAQVIVEAFQEAGFTDVHAIGEGIDGMTKEEWQQEYSKVAKEAMDASGQTYIVVDRHKSDGLNPNRVLQTPLSSFVADLIEKLDAEVDPEKMAEAVKNRVASELVAAAKEIG